MRFIYILLMLFSTLCANAQLISAVRDCKGQRELGELEGTYIYHKAFQNVALDDDAYIQCWRTNALTPKGQTDSLTISSLKTYCFTEKIEGKEMGCKCVFHDRIVLKGLKIFYQRYKKDNKINKEPKYFIMGTYERWSGDFDLNKSSWFYDKKEYSNFDTTKIGKRFRRKYEPHESELEVTKDFFDWLHQLSDEWKITEIESEKIEDHDSSGFDPFWLY